MAIVDSSRVCRLGTFIKMEIVDSSRVCRLGTFIKMEIVVYVFILILIFLLFVHVPDCFIHKYALILRVLNY
jgi:hypothetical protein